MRYLGGKSRLAKEIATIVAPQGIWWEPFCGGLSVSVQLAKYGPGLISDANAALISLYKSVAIGWLPPEAVTAEEYQAAKALPDSDPRKAFIGIACSFQAKWFAGYSGEARRQEYTKKGEATKTMWVDPCGSTCKTLLRDIPALSLCTFRHLSFLDVDPLTFPSCPETIYCDPPYAGTTGYTGVGAFDHRLFWTYCQEWASRGARVFVSEYACPVGCDVVLERAHRTTMNLHERTTGSRIERLFRVQAPSVARCG